MISIDKNENKYYLSLDDAKADGFTPIKATSMLSFFKISDKCRVVSKENIIPFPDLQYLIYCKAEGRYYLKRYRNYDIDDTFFYYQRKGNVKEELESLFMYIADGNLYLLFTAQDLLDIKDMMVRCYKQMFKNEPPTERWSSIFYEIMREILRYDEYKDIGKELTGYKTVCNQFETRIAELWMSVNLKTK